MRTLSRLSRPVPAPPVGLATAVSTRLRRLALVVAALVPAVLCPGLAAGAPSEPDPVGVWPLAPAPPIIERFDPPQSRWGPGHRGVDLLGRVGQPVRAALPGRVSFAGAIAGRGVVVVDHGATRTTYEPVVATVPVGTPVAAGQRIGRLTLPGSHCLPRACLHWGWIEGETYLDPLRLVGAGPVRLLPLGRDQPVAAAGTPRWRPPPLPYAAWRAPVTVLASLLPW